MGELEASLAEIDLVVSSRPFTWVQPDKTFRAIDRTVWARVEDASRKGLAAAAVSYRCCRDR